jgi:hypothetical protein
MKEIIFVNSSIGCNIEQAELGVSGRLGGCLTFIYSSMHFFIDKQVKNN